MEIYRTDKINEHLYAIGEYFGEYPMDIMWLVIGKERAALIDTGMGTDDLKKFVRNLTSLPLVVLNTHGDPDHIGGNPLFEECYLNERDVPLIPWALSVEKRMYDIGAMTKEKPELYQYIQEHIVAKEEFVRKDIDEGDVIDLGGIRLEALAVPGHTKGSIVYMDRENRAAFTGDTIIQAPWMFLDRCTSVEAFKKTLIHFSERTVGIESLYCGHSVKVLSPDITESLVVCADEIMEGAPGEPQFHPFVGEYLMHNCHGSQVGICFSKDKIFENQLK